MQKFVPASAAVALPPHNKKESITENRYGKYKEFFNGLEKVLRYSLFWICLPYRKKRDFSIMERCWLLLFSSAVLVPWVQVGSWFQLIFFSFFNNQTTRCNDRPASASYLILTQAKLRKIHQSCQNRPKLIETDSLCIPRVLKIWSLKRSSSVFLIFHRVNVRC